MSRTAIKGGNFVFTCGQQEQPQTMVGNWWFGGWNISKVTTMGLMFAGATSIDILVADGDGTYEGVLTPGVSLEIGYMDPQHEGGSKSFVLHSLMSKSK